MPERPDFVLSGINHGQNMGEDVLYSGTVAAAMEGLALGIPSIAISFAGGDLRADVTHLQEQVKVLTPLLAHLTSLPAFPAEHAAQREPAAACRRTRCKGVRLTRLGRRVYSDSLTPMKDPWGATDLLDRRRRHHAGRGEDGLGLPRDRGRLRLGDAAASRPHALRRARSGGDLVAGPVDGEIPRRAPAPRRDAAREGHSRPRRAARVRADAAARVRADGRAASRLRGRAAADRQRPDDLAAVGPRALPRAAAAHRAGARARDRHRLGLSDRAARAPRRAGVLDRADSGAAAAGARDHRSAPACSNVSLLLGDGTLGWREYAPYDAILVSAGAPSVPAAAARPARRGRAAARSGRRSRRAAARASSTRERRQRRDAATSRRCGSFRSSATTAGSTARAR